MVCGRQSNGNRGRRIRNLYKFPQGRKVSNFHLPVTLEDYRTLYRAYLEDPDLQDARARWPFVCVWDNHEFAWAGYQSQYVAGGGYNAPAQNQKIYANQAWWEFIPAMVQQPGNPKLEQFVSPKVVDTPMEEFNDDGLSEEPNNLLAINSLKIQRVLRWGKNVDLLLTDNWSFRSPDMSTDDFEVPEYPRVSPQIPLEIMNYGRHYNDDNPPDTIRFQRQGHSESDKRSFCADLSWVLSKDAGSSNSSGFLLHAGKYGDTHLALWNCGAIIKICPGELGASGRKMRAMR
ncbi:MAG: alkaline phosphatase D family protein [Bacteroidetes bacterium]|nr:alkaline phosphatase D family protein [Bacteroidota bacterium]